jgi:catechol 2,3-dioxygenase-like lactoylglutathione lyase family enzyme
MKIDAVAVSTSNMQRSIAFYTMLGFDFSDSKGDEDHVEPITPVGSARLMIDKKAVIEGIMGAPPKPGNHSNFAIQFDSSDEIDTICANLKEAGFSVVKEPWDAFWGQHYAIVQDPDAYLVDLYAAL